MDEMSSTYESDFYTWTLETAQKLREGKLPESNDMFALIEEIEDLGLRKYDSFVSHLAICLQHKLKWDHQPEKRSRSWLVSMKTHSYEAQKVLAKNPGLRARLPEALTEAYEDAIRFASAETEIPRRAFPLTCPYTLDQILAELD